MANFTNVTSATTTTLNAIGVGNGSYKLKITNNLAANQTVTVQLVDSDSNIFYVIKNLVMPEATSVVIDNMMYDSTFYSAQVITTGTTNITITQIYI